MTNNKIKELILDGATYDNLLNITSLLSIT